MQRLLQVNRELRDIEDPKLRSREFYIKKIQTSYGYDRNNAEKVFEIMQVKSVEAMWGSACGAVAWYKAGPIQREIEHSYSIFRKAWMRQPIRLAAFAAAYWVGTALPTRFFRKFENKPEGVTSDTFKSRHDLVGRFRVFEEDEPSDALESQVADYLAAYSSDPLSEPELLDHLMKQVSKKVDLSKIFQVKRLGADADDIFWSFGKIHGLENIAYCDDQALKACGGNPVKLQKLVNEVETNRRRHVAESPEAAEAKLVDHLENYKNAVNKMNLHVSDRKKLLALPFYLAKRQELPEPKRGQPEMELFEELTGMNWYEDARTRQDNEEKITEFNFEKFLSADLLATVDTDGPEFKTFVKLANLTSATKHERLQKAKEQFKSLMPLLASLTPVEQRSLVHLIQSRSEADRLADLTASKDIERQLAQVSEKENMAMKNRYRHQRQTMDFAEAKKMPVDERKVKDMLRNQHVFRDRMNAEIGTYQRLQDNPQLENGVLSYLHEAAYGEMKDLITDVGINYDSIPFHNLAALRKFNDNNSHESDGQFHNLMHALFTPVDMTDHEEEFVGWNEVAGTLPINR